MPGQASRGLAREHLVSPGLVCLRGVTLRQPAHREGGPAVQFWVWTSGSRACPRLHCGEGVLSPQSRRGPAGGRGEGTIGARGTAAPALRPGHHARPPPSCYTGSDPPAAACLPSVALRLIMFLLFSFHCCFILRERK